MNSGAEERVSNAKMNDEPAALSVLTPSNGFNQAIPIYNILDETLGRLKAVFELIGETYLKNSEMALIINALIFTSNIDKHLHIDIIAETLSSNVYLIDVKAPSPGNFDTGNYSIGIKEIELLKRTTDTNRWFMFRLVENGVLTGKFIMVNAKDVVEKCRLQNKEEYVLVNVNDIKTMLPYKILEPDIPDIQAE